MNPESLGHHLDTADTLAGVLAHARLLARLQSLFAEMAPAPLCDLCSVANCKQGIVVIHAPSSAVAVKIKQIAPRLVRTFCDRGVDLIEIRVKVQPGGKPPPKPALPARPLGTPARGRLSGLEASLPEGRLKNALADLLKRSA